MCSYKLSKNCFFKYFDADNGPLNGCVVHYIQVETLRADNTFVTEQMANCKGICID